MRRVLALVFFVFALASTASAAENAAGAFRDKLLSYFKAVSGKVVKSAPEGIELSSGENDGVKPGMRLKVLRQGAPFIHPVTKELLGRTESLTGRIEITGVAASSSTARLVEGEAASGDIVRISETRVRVLFCQDSGIDWFSADEYYRALKGSERIEMIDTALETADETKVLTEASAKNADIAVIVSAAGAGKEAASVRVRAFWTLGGTRLVDDTGAVSGGGSETRIGDNLFGLRSDEPELTIDLPFGARLIASGDLDGNGRNEIIMSTGKKIRVFMPGADLYPLWELEGSSFDEPIRLDAADVDNDGKDEIIVSSMRAGGPLSTIFRLSGSELKKVCETDFFMRRLGKEIIGQSYSSSEGFAGGIFRVIPKSGGCVAGEAVKIPAGLNIYDFTPVDGTDSGKMYFSYDDAGYVSVVDESGTRLWKSSYSNGGFPVSFRKQSSTVSYLDSGDWYVKDRLMNDGRGVLGIQRIPITQMTKTIGFKSSRIRKYVWNGLSVDDAVLVDNIKGTVVDLASGGDKIYILVRPLLGIKFGNLLKGEDPLGAMLYVYTRKGR